MRIKGNTFPCGKCVECLVKRSNEWAYRIMHEAQQYKDNCFITLTYNEEHLPDKGNLSRRDLTLFLKRLRKKIGKFRYFACGEYGAKGNRPHYHIIIFGKTFEDKIYFCCDNKKQKLFRSVTLEKIWNFGYSCLGDLTFESAKYCAKYMQKSRMLDSDKVKPFTTMSLKPGIGFNSVDFDMLKTDKIYHNGKYISIPRYYIKVLDKFFPGSTDEVKLKRSNRVKRAVDDYDNYFIDLERRQKKYQRKLGFSIDNKKK